MRRRPVKIRVPAEAGTQDPKRHTFYSGIPAEAGTQSQERRAYNPGLLLSQEHGTERLPPDQRLIAQAPPDMDRLHRLRDVMDAEQLHAGLHALHRQRE